MKYTEQDFKALREKYGPDAMSKDAYWSELQAMVLENLEDERDARRFDALGRPRG